MIDRVTMVGATADDWTKGPEPLVVMVARAAKAGLLGEEAARGVASDAERAGAAAAFEAGREFEAKSLEATLIRSEYERASAKFPPFNSAHEGFAVLKEEVDELWDIVKTNPKKLDGGEEEWRSKMRAEAIQIGAMALRFLKDVCP